MHWIAPAEKDTANGDLDPLPILRWIMLVKFLDELTLQREGEVKLARKKFKPAL